MSPASNKEPPAALGAYVVSAVLVAIACAFGLGVDAWINPPNISMVFLAAVLASAIRYGLWPSLFASVLSTLLYNILFLEPRYSLTIEDPSNVVALVFLLIVAVLTSELTARLKRQATAAKAHAAANAALFEYSGKIAGIGRLDDLVWASAHQIAAMLDAAVVILLPKGDHLELAGSYPPDDSLTGLDREAATLAWQSGKAAGRETGFCPGAAWLFVPMTLAQGSVGTIGLKRRVEAPPFSVDERKLIAALADQAAVAVERIGLARDVEQARLSAESERLRVALLGAISHDFRTPLAAIIGSASSLRSQWDRLDPKDRGALLDTIRSESERLNRFIGNVLEMTKLESGQLTVRRVPTDLLNLVQATEHEMTRTLGGHTVRLRAHKHVPLADIDPVLARQVILNLLDNAAKFAPPGTAIDIGVHRAGNALVMVEVRDEGPGIPPEQLEQVFQRFFRIGSGDRRRAGTGLGLAICKGFVEAMSGTITARNRDDRSGAIFTVSLPAATIPFAPTTETRVGADRAAHTSGR